MRPSRGACPRGAPPMCCVVCMYCVCVCVRVSRGLWARGGGRRLRCACVQVDVERAPVLLAGCGRGSSGVEHLWVRTWAAHVRAIITHDPAMPAPRCCAHAPERAAGGRDKVHRDAGCATLPRPSATPAPTLGHATAAPLLRRTLYPLAHIHPTTHSRAPDPQPPHLPRRQPAHVGARQAQDGQRHRQPHDGAAGQGARLAVGARRVSGSEAGAAHATLSRARREACGGNRL